MIEQPIDIQIPPGLFMNGTMKERAGRWADGNLVQFIGAEGHPAPWRGWSEMILSGAIVGTPRVMLGIESGSVEGVTSSLIVVTSSKMYVVSQSMVSSTQTLEDITPSGGLSDFGETYVFGIMGDLLFLSRAGEAVDTKFWKWSLVSGGDATAITPTGVTNLRGAFVTPESFLVLIDGLRDIAWASQGLSSAADFVPTSTNSAGALTLQTTGKLLRGEVVGEKALIWSSIDLWNMDYVGGDLIYGAKKIGDACGILGPNTLAVVENAAYWMSDNGFYFYDGYVRPLPCDISEYVFGDMDREHSSAFFCVHVPTAHEIRWHYCSTISSGIPDSVVSYNYLNQTWSKGALQRAAGTQTSTWQEASSGAPTSPNVMAVPVLASSTGDLYIHEIEEAAADAYIASGPIQLGSGERTMRVQKIIADGADITDEITLFKGSYPGEAESFENFPVPDTRAPIDARFSARYIRYKQTLNALSSRVGVPQLGIIPGGRR